MIRIEGLIAAIFTPFNEDGSLNLPMIPAIVDKMAGDGMAGVFVCGTNGEGPNMTVAERMDLSKAVVQAANKRLKVFVHVGHTSIEESRKLAAHAAHIGADAISAVAAFYFKPTSVRNLVESIGSIAAAAPELPFYYYHIPVLTGVGMDMVEFLRLSQDAIPNLAGIKYTAPTLQEYQACVNFNNGQYDILYGTDEMLLPALSVGAKGAIGSTYSFAGPLYLQIMKLFSSGKLDAAQQLQLQCVEMIRRFLKYPSLPAQRAIMQILGWNIGPCRLPLKPLNAEEVADLKASLDDMGFLDLLAPVTEQTNHA
ncbi:dihydrodipicolinate synthase family protein [Chitinophaga cymbidii]|uniref:N-acetylneuraminate lyase n=1 Tax=Chitinophaga cymbidii TaxID=1096750 RepID=A0A512RKI4_9BACT|nr:dihydrodipicolinate synthase family protein [Chitinophaga cymbidii]GEP96207.1 N-acetylneuraminate lyase [Chitinophaga cymbidii]